MKGNFQRYLSLGVAALTVALITLCVTSQRHYSSEEIVISRLENEPETAVTKPVVIKEGKSPATKPAASAAASENTEAVTSELIVDISTATAEELCRLDGIGPAKAAAIIAYREENGGFTGKDDIMNVSGIGIETYEAIEPHITVSMVKMTTAAVTAEETTEPETPVFPETEPSTENELTLEDIAPIDLNKATKEELMLLPYVDDKAAEAILSLREDIHGFSHVYELLYVDELTQKQVAELIEFVTVGE